MRAIQTVGVQKTFLMLAGMLLSLLLTGSAWALTATDCSTCHGASVVEGHHNTVDPNSDFNQGLCSKCHVGITTGNDCSTCHQPAGYTFNSHHLLQTGQTAINCAQCHTGAGNPKDCGSCHKGDVPRNFHHTQLVAYRNTTTGKLDCTPCHSGAQLTSDCTSCHAEGASFYQTKHHDYVNPATTTKPVCTACHTQLKTATGSCQDCHVPRTPKTMTAHHSSTASCSSCHASANYAQSNCSTCHGFLTNRGKAALDKSPNKHHDAININTFGCGPCHSGNTSVSIAASDCFGCHEYLFPAVNLATAHHATAPYGSGTCSTCHDGTQNIYQTCQSCHEKVLVNGVATTVSSSAWHHMTVAYSTGVCATCHKTTDGSSLQKACADCHVGSDQPSTVTRHHATDAYLTGKCGDCHLNTAPANIPCAGCHTSTTTKHHSKTVTVNNTIQPKPCRDCHSTITLATSTCTTCHTVPMKEFHHDKGPNGPLTKVGGNCAVCHQSVSDPKICANCHVSTPHHTTTWSTSGDCAHCHVVPASATDRPAQAACRECHAGMQHTNGPGPSGIPVQNYGACAACHNTIPYHPAPASIPGYTGYGAGKGKFNIFWSKYAIKEGPGERLSPNGYRSNDAGGYRIKDQQLTFSTKQISSNGKTYTVPYFTGLASVNLALKKIVTASGAESGYGAALAVDGDVATRWWKKVSYTTSTQWLRVDLGSTKKVGKVALRWNSYYAKKYDIQVSIDGMTWTTVFTNAYGAGGMETRTFTDRDARYIRIYCREATSLNGYSIFELEAYAP